MQDKGSPKVRYGTFVVDDQERTDFVMVEQSGLKPAIFARNKEPVARQTISRAGDWRREKRHAPDSSRAVGTKLKNPARGVGGLVNLQILLNLLRRPRRRWVMGGCGCPWVFFASRYWEVVGVEGSYRPGSNCGPVFEKCPRPGGVGGKKEGTNSCWGGRGGRAGLPCSYLDWLCRSG